MRRSVLPLVLALAVLGLGGTLLRSWVLGYPLVPRITERLWEARLAVQWEPGQAPVTALLPRSTRRQELRDEHFFSGPLEPTLRVEPGGNRRVLWEGEGATAVTYQAEILVRDAPLGAAPTLQDLDRWRRSDEFPLPVAAAATRLASQLDAADSPRRCFDLVSGRAPAPAGFAEDLARIRAALATPAEALVLCWRAAGLPARLAQVLPLRNGIFRRPEVLPQVFDGSRWRLADPAGGRFPAAPLRWLIWNVGRQPVAEGHDGTPAAWEVQLQERHLPLWADFFHRTAGRSSLLARWSLYALPPATQEVFRVLVLVPIGALMVGLLRTVVGLATFGTFMPILIAIAFRQTQLLYGLSLFALVVAVGYLVRVAIDRYKLLLVPRLATILTFVIGCLAALALVGAHLGLVHVLSVGLLPMVILTVTIERFFVVAEESGARVALRMAASTGAVAAITYGIISWEYLQFLFFTYPEPLLGVAAGQIALGRYLGFRLTELWRFRRLAEAV
jgi:hypothetical protein